ncbi:MAG: PilZ domain-containing protein [Desulfobacteraceae bacterium]|nr:PilZ domain-containing protein [Desulfobacteraceae bacterium]
MVKQDGTKSDLERRKHERVDFLTSINVIIDSKGKKINVKGDSRDLSIKGAFIPTKKKVPIGSPCSVKIILSGSNSDVELDIKGVVARAEHNGVGIVFDSIDVDSFMHLKNIVKYNSENN